VRIGDGTRYLQGERRIEHERVPVRAAILAREHGTHADRVVRGVPACERLRRAAHEAERERIARQYRAEGEEQALSIRADADRQREEILSVAYKQAEKVKGEGDAESTRVYGQAFNRNPRLYKLLRTLEAYKKVLDDKTTAILSSDSELLKILTHGEAGAR